MRRAIKLALLMWLAKRLGVEVRDTQIVMGVE